MTWSLNAETTLYDELKFLEEASADVEVYLPGDKKKKKKSGWVSDSVSTGQAGLVKKSVITDTYDNTSKPKKRLRYRSR